MVQTKLPIWTICIDTHWAYSNGASFPLQSMPKQFHAEVSMASGGFAQFQRGIPMRIELLCLGLILYPNDRAVGYLVGQIRGAMTICKVL